MNLYAGKILVVDLTTRRVTTEPIRKEWLREYLGSWGLAVRYYWDTVTPEVEPLSSENAMVIMTGPFTGTLIPMTSRLSLVSKSPHTNTIFQSNIGGAFGPELKYAGYDGLIIKGKADTPVYLKIEDDQVSIENAEALAGKGIFETERLLEEAIGSLDAKCLSIGPAGENQVSYSIVGSDAYRQMGRSGVGALFGSKNLKGIVCRGTGDVRVADMDSFLEKVTHYKKTALLNDDNLWVATDGTPMSVDLTNEFGIHPTRNYTQGVNDNASAINSDAIKAVKVADRACASCPMACGKFTRVGDVVVEGPEYETLCLGGSNCEINDLGAIIRFNNLCDDLGLDTMSCGNTIGLAMDITESDRGDLGLRFGEVDEYLKIIEEIATLSTERGCDLAMGAKKLADKYQSQDMSMEVKGMEMPAYDPRGNYGMGLAYATSERGACHLRAFPLFAEDPFDIESLVQDVVAGQNFGVTKGSMCFCEFWVGLDDELLADLLTSGLGETVTAEELDKAGERIWNLTRLFNVKNGFTDKEDCLPEKVLKRKLEKGPNAGRTFSLEDFGAAMQAYYRLRGWNQEGCGEARRVEFGKLL